MKSIPFGIALVMTFLSCHQGSIPTDKNAKPTADTNSMVGNDSDSHGCKASAGYRWSSLQQSCVRPWEKSIVLNAVDSMATYESAAYLFFSADSSRAEIFLKEVQGSLLLSSHAPQQYTHKPYSLRLADSLWILEHASTVRYRQLAKALPE